MDTHHTHRFRWALALGCLIAGLAACSAVEATSVSVPSITSVQPGTTFFTFRSPAPKDDMYAVAWSPDGRYIAYGGSDALVYVWDRQAHSLAFTARGHTADIWSLAWSPDGKRLASASWDHTVQVWDAATGQHLLTYRGHTDLVLAVA